MVQRGTTGASSTRCAAARRAPRRSASARPASGHRVRACSAGIAGFGGGLLAVLRRRGQLRPDFTFFFGLVWVVLVVTVGARSVQAAIIAGLAFFLVPELLDRLFAWPGNYLASHSDVGLRRRSSARQARVGRRRVVHPVRPRCAHLRQAPRGHHRGAGRAARRAASPDAGRPTGRRRRPPDAGRTAGRGPRMTDHRHARAPADPHR